MELVFHCLNAVLLALLAAAFVWIQCWIGGTRLVFSMPAYGLLALAGLLSILLIEKGRARPRISCLLTATILGGYVLVRAARSPTDFLWWSDYFMVTACLIAYLLVALYLESNRLRTALVVVFFVMVAAQFFWPGSAFRQFALGDNHMAFGFMRPNMGRRASGFFISSISLAGYLEAAGVIALSMACWSRWQGWLRGLAGMVAALCWAGVAVTGSRGGYLSTIVSLLAFAVLSLVIVRRLNPEMFGPTAAIGGILFGALLIGAPFLMSKNDMLRRRLTLLTGQMGGNQQDARIYNWQAALDQFRQAPLLGTGAGTHLYYGRMFRRPELQADPVHAHSDYLELLAEYGVAGGAAMALFLITHLWSGWRSISRLIEIELQDRYRSRTTALALQVGALSAVAAYLAHSAIDFNLHIPANALLFAMIFGILANPGIEERRERSRSETGEKPHKHRSRGIRIVYGAALPALGVLLILSGVWLRLPVLPLPGALQPRPLRGENLGEQARVALRNGSFPEAIDLGRHALALQTRNPEIYFTMGEANRAMARSLTSRTLRRPYYEAAAESYRNGLKIFPKDENLLVRLGQALDGLNEFPEAAEAYKKAIELDPNLGVLHVYYAAHLRACGRTEEAQAELTAGEDLAKRNLAPLMENALARPKNEEEAKIR